MPRIRNLVLAIAVSFAASPVASSWATTINTYSFTMQTNAANGAVVSGSFTGVVDTLGYITKQNLLGFNAEINVHGVTAFSVDDAIFRESRSIFSFDTSGPPLDVGSLDIFGIGTSGAMCIGAAVSFGLCGARAPTVHGYFNNYQEIYLSTDFPTITLEGSVVTGGVPEPATWAMMLLGFAAVGYVARRRRNHEAFRLI